MQPLEGSGQDLEFANTTIGNEHYRHRTTVTSTSDGGTLAALQEISNLWFGGVKVVNWVTGATDGGGMELTLLSRAASGNVIGRVYQYI